MMKFSCSCLADMATSVPSESKVSYEFLGRSGLKVSNISLGCMTFGESAVSFCLCSKLFLSTLCHAVICAFFIRLFDKR